MLSLVRKSARRPHPLPVVSLQRATLVTANELRSKFLQYFQSKGHTIVPGSSVIPEDDPSLLFVNAGMNQFKKYYLGELVPWVFAWYLRNSEKRRLTTSQLCIRAGGKHNDLDNVVYRMTVKDRLDSRRAIRPCSRCSATSPSAITTRRRRLSWPTTL